MKINLIKGFFFILKIGKELCRQKKWVQIQRIGIESCKHYGILELETTKFDLAT